ncbi:hypothetical protein BKA82DRAFT_4331170 [Pisolithus tinctorius]|nr:hypothetical protein BKA82DRAFT_4331170 [Pisolithus tinctorius]
MPNTGTTNNPTGINGYGVKNCLKTYLHALNKQFNVPSPCKPPSEDIVTQAVLVKVAEDINQEIGVNAITSCLNFVCSVLACHASNGLICCSALVAIGPNYQHHADGFEKLNAQALQMGGVGLNIYRIKDQWSSFLLHLVVVLNNSLASTVGHVLIPTMFVMDKGTETGLMFSNQEALHMVFAPDIDSVHNMPIESLWHWFSKTHGINLKLLLQSKLGCRQPVHIRRSQLKGMFVI